MKKHIACLLCVGLPLFISACTPAEQPAQAAKTPDSAQDSAAHHPHDIDEMVKLLAQDDAEAADEPTAKPIITHDGKLQIDWSYIHTDTKAANLENYPYPIALDTQAVHNYAKHYQISDKEAQHSIVVGMAAPEVLGKLLDQLDGHYRSHELQDGAQMALIVHVSDKVVADQQDYVFADKFAEGLSIPVIIKPIKPTYSADGNSTGGQ